MLHIICFAVFFLCCTTVDFLPRLKTLMHRESSNRRRRPYSSEQNKLKKKNFSKKAEVYENIPNPLISLRSNTARSKTNKWFKNYCKQHRVQYTLISLSCLGTDPSDSSCVFLFMGLIASDKSDLFPSKQTLHCQTSSQHLKRLFPLHWHSQNVPLSPVGVKESRKHDWT